MATRLVSRSELYRQLTDHHRPARRRELREQLSCFIHLAPCYTYNGMNLYDPKQVKQFISDIASKVCRLAGGMAVIPKATIKVPADALLALREEAQQ